MTGLHRVSEAAPDVTNQDGLHAPETDDGLAIKVRGLRNAFGAQVIHDQLDLDVRRGEILGVVGGSGTGKSVLMRSIIGLQVPEHGEITVFGTSTLDLSDDAATRDVRRRWGVLFQGGALFSTLTVAENVQVPIREFYPELGQQLLDDISAYKVVLAGLPANAGPKYPSELSGGMVKRAALARALALDPALLFLDEPTAGLDPISAAAFDELIRDLADTLGLTVLLITHDLDTLHSVCDRVAVLADRRVIAIGTIDQLVATDHPWIQEYFMGPRGRAAQLADTRRSAGNSPDIQASGG
ncbi:ATP-binding cassette domain-containing protein [Sphingomonas lacunae]|uniref:ATP-binding cassette domain-containing protein n=2 Tax=Sphingomonas lacunae TaxID=2698828 RepID=A0A6M4B2H9_9SPHN|nr:ATP-binding cassette domain-containing protein [Sphingomonas lacunae]QJQ33641.1 ATP-binding cassette domain-containing protein [Sphingomonas lacunae]